MDDLDHQLIGLLSQDSRLPVASLAAATSVSRATVKARIDRLVENGTIEAFTIRLGAELRQAEVRAIVLIEVAGQGGRPRRAAPARRARGSRALQHQRPLGLRRRARGPRPRLVRRDAETAAADRRHPLDRDEHPAQRAEAGFALARTLTPAAASPRAERSTAAKRRAARPAPRLAGSLRSTGSAGSAARRAGRGTARPCAVSPAQGARPRRRGGRQ